MDTNTGKFEAFGVNVKDVNNMDTIEKVTAQFDNLEICVVDVKGVEDTYLIDQLTEQFEVDTGIKIYPGTRETLFKYLQKMCNSNQETLLCPMCSVVF